MPASGTSARRLRRWALTGTLLALAALAAAVATGLLTQRLGEPATEPSPRDPLVGHGYYSSAAAVCELLTPDDLELVTGRGYQEGFPPTVSPAFLGIPGVSKCAYRSQSGGGAVETGVVYAYADKVFERARQYAQDYGDPRNVTDVGTAAFYGLDELVVLTGDKIVAVVFPRDHVEPDQNRLVRAKRLARKMMERLR